MSENYILLTYRDGVRTVKFNRPERKNAVTISMYETLTKVLTEDAEDDKIVVTLITGAGDYFTSGNDLKQSMSGDTSTAERFSIVKNMVNAFINYPKLLIAIVNGPAIGIGATMSALCDIIYATDKAVFDTPFVKLGLCVEGASSFIFPYNLGRSKASEVLYLNHKLGAQEAYQFGLISKVIPQNELDGFINGLYKYGKMSPNSLKRNKKLVMANFKTILCECNSREIEQLYECVESEEFSNAIMEFMNKKSKL